MKTIFIFLITLISISAYAQQKYKYVTTWMLIRQNVIPCQDTTKTDEFGREKKPALKVHCFTYDTLSRQRIFLNRDSAFAFYTKGKEGVKDDKLQRSNYFQRKIIANMTIDSVKIKQ